MAQDQVKDSVNIIASAPVRSPIGDIFDPTSLPPEGDPFAQIMQLLTNLQNTPPPQPKQSKLATILNAIASGGAILGSADPGGTLNAQLKQRADLQFQREQAENQRQQQIQVAMIQAGLEKARGTQKEQADVRREKRELTAKGIESDIRVSEQNQIDINKLDIRQRELIQTEEFLNKTLPDQVKRMVLLNPDLTYKSIAFAQQMQEVVPSMPAFVAREISDKLFGRNSQPFTKEETIFYNRFKIESKNIWQQDRDLARRVKEGQISKDQAEAEYYRKVAQQGGSKTNPILAQIVDEKVRQLTSTFMKHKITGQIVPATDVSKMFVTEQLQFVPASPEEQQAERNKRIEELTKLQTEMENNRLGINPEFIGKPDPNAGKAMTAQEIIQDARNKGRTDEQIRAILQANGLDPNLVNTQQQQFSIKQMENIVAGLERMVKDNSPAMLSQRADLEARLQYAREQLDKAKKAQGLK